MQYLLDTNTFIQAKNSYYAFDIAPSFWTQLLEKLKQGQVAVIDAVSDEIKQGNDELKEWFKDQVISQADQIKILQAKEDATVLAIYREIAQMVAMNQVYKESEKARFFRGADPWLIASAKSWEAVVVTCETLSGVGTTKVKIPDICQQTGVSFVNLYTAMRAMQIVL